MYYPFMVKEVIELKLKSWNYRRSIDENCTYISGRLSTFVFHRVYKFIHTLFCLDLKNGQ